MVKVDDKSILEVNAQASQGNWNGVGRFTMNLRLSFALAGTEPQERIGLRDLRIGALDEPAAGANRVVPVRPCDRQLGRRNTRRILGVLESTWSAPRTLRHFSRECLRAPCYQRKRPYGTASATSSRTSPGGPRTKAATAQPSRRKSDRGLLRGEKSQTTLTRSSLA